MSETPEVSQGSEPTPEGPRFGPVRRTYLWVEARLLRLWDALGLRGERLGARFADAWLRRPQGGWRDYLALLVGCFVCTTAVLHGILFTHDYYWGSGTDIVGQHFPSRDYVFYWLKKGVVPLWNPYIFNGLPLQTGVKPSVYLPNLLGVVLSDPGLEIRLTFWLHLTAGCVFMAWFMLSFRLCRAACLLGGLLYGLGGFNLGHMFAGHIDVVTTSAWGPLVLAAGWWGTYRRGAAGLVLAALALAFMVTAAHFQIIYLTIWTAFVLLVVTVLLGSRRGVPPVRLWPAWDTEMEDRDPAAPATQLLADQVAWQTRGRDLFWLIVRWLLIGALAGLFAAYQMLPSLESVRHSNRAHISYSVATEFGSPALNWLVYLVPHLFEASVDPVSWASWISWEGQCYLSLPGLVLALLACWGLTRRTWLPLLSVGVFASILGMGPSTPLYSVYYHLDPVVGNFRVPSRFLLVATVVGAWLASLGFQWLVDRQEGWSRKLLQVVLVLSLPLALAWVGLYLTTPLATNWWGRFVHYAADKDLWSAIIGDVWGDNLHRLLVMTWLRVTWALTLLGLTAYLVIRLAPRRGIALLLALVILDLAVYARPYLRTESPSKFWLPSEVLKFLGDNQVVQRVMADNDLNWADRFAAYEVAEVGGYEAFANPTYTEAFNIAMGWPRENRFTRAQVFDKKPFFDIQGARFMFTAHKKDELPEDLQQRMASCKLVVDTEDLKVYDNPDAFGRAFVVHGITQAKSDELTLLLVALNSEVVRRNVVMSPAEGKKLTEEVQRRGFSMPEIPLSEHPTFDDKISDLQIRPNEVTLNATLSKPGMLVLTDAYWPGWKARVDGEPVAIWPANGGLHRGLLLDTGEHSVRFYYWPDTLTLGLKLTAVSLAVCLSYLTLGWTLRRRASAAAAGPSA